LGLEDLDPGPFSPRVSGEAGFEAAVTEECFPVPAVLGRNLGQEKAALEPLGNDDPVPSDLDLRGLLD